MTTHLPPRHSVPPPRLSMDEYVELVESTLRERDPRLAGRQKELEERVRSRFSLAEAGDKA